MSLFEELNTITENKTHERYFTEIKKYKLLSYGATIQIETTQDEQSAKLHIYCLDPEIGLRKLLSVKIKEIHITKKF